LKKTRNRFEKIEFDSTDVPKKPTIIEKLKFRRKLELGNEAQAESINQDIKKASLELDKQIEENERRRAIKRQHALVKTIEHSRKQELLDLELKVAIAEERSKKAKSKIWGMGFIIGTIALLFYFGGQGNRFLVELIITIVLAFFGIGRFRRRF
jgi:hypothetical protein